MAENNKAIVSSLSGHISDMTQRHVLHKRNSEINCSHNFWEFRLSNTSKTNVPRLLGWKLRLSEIEYMAGNRPTSVRGKIKCRIPGFANTTQRKMAVGEFSG